MKTWIRLAMLIALTVGGTIAMAAREAKPMDASTPAAARARDDNMTPYRNLAADTLKAFKGNDLATARKKAKELETAWDKNEKALQKKSPDVWGQIDKAMDDFIKPLAAKSPDAGKVQAGYDAFIAKLQLAVKG
jgi:esterase/lipase